MIRAHQVFKRFTNPPTTILHSISIEIAEGEFVSIVGRSGSGKTTLLYLLSTLDVPTEGTIELGGVNPTKLREEDLHIFRNQNIGYVFQFHYLLPELTVLENAVLPARKTKQHLKKKQRAMELLEIVGLSEKLNRFPSQLSGGEQQRVAIARALLMNPKFIFADEPTGNLDSVNGRKVMELLKKMNKETGATIVLVTHEASFAEMADRCIFLADGRVAEPSDRDH